MDRGHAGCHGPDGEVMILIADFFLDAISIYTVFLPILIPVMASFGWDPVWFGVVVTLNLAICTITPPIAVNLYVASNISGASMEEVSRWVLPFFAALMVVLVLVMFIPALSLWLPDTLGIR